MKYHTRVYNYIDEVPKTVWSTLIDKNNTYFTKPYLKAFETQNSHCVQFFYIVISDEKKPISLAIIQILEFNFSVADFTPNANVFVQKASYHLSCFLKRDYVKILICGSAFVSGEHGIYVHSSANKTVVIELISKAIQVIINANKHLKRWVDVIVIKDFISTSIPITKKFKKHQYTPIQVDPNMVLDLQPEWDSFNTYLQAFKSKFRVKAKKAYKTSSALVEKDFTAAEIKKHAAQLSVLYNNVNSKANLTSETLNINTYAALKLVLKDKFIFRVYYLDSEIVGFMSGVISQGTLDAHYVGINYSLNKKYAIYSRMLYDYVKIGLDKKVSAINFGRTSGEIKSSLGAVPQELTCYVRHKKTMANIFFKPFIAKIKPSQFNQRRPFK